MTKRIIIFLALALTGCVQTDIQETLLAQSEISLTWKGNTQVVYSSSAYQIGYNNLLNEYRIYDDKLANWFTVRCSEKPSAEGQMLTADVSWTGKTSTKSFTAKSFEVKKADEFGLVWLWCNSEKIGIIIKNIQ